MKDRVSFKFIVSLKKNIKDINSSLNIYNKFNTKNSSYATNRETISYFYYYANAIVNGRSFSDETRQKLSHSLVDILIDCRFNFHKCTSDDFTHYFDTFYGNCYSFNSIEERNSKGEKLRKASLPGWTYGLQLSIYTNFYSNLSLLNSAQSGSGFNQPR